LTDADIEKMVKDAEAHKAEDEKRKKVVEARNQAESLIHNAEKQVKDAGDKVSAEDKALVETASADLKAVKDGEDIDAIEAKTQALTQALMKVGEALYKAQAAEGGPGADGGAEGAGDQAGAQGSANDEKVVDADFEEVDDRKGKSA
jgi:molecular chaperone DnaK